MRQTAAVRASRLVSLLLLVQTRGRMTADQLAAELEVSPRTIYRDIDALVASGVPIYGEPGHDGGYRLVDGYRTRLTGLTSDEARALVLSGLPGPAAELGLGMALSAAQLKLAAALPAELREHIDLVRQRFLLDAPGWYTDLLDTPFLSAVADAVWQRRTLHVRYSRWREPTDIERELRPHGLVLKAGHWYVVAEHGELLRTYRVDQILRLSVGAPFTARPDFDLAGYWRDYLADFRARLRWGEAVIRVAPHAVPELHQVLGREVAAAVASHGQVEADGWTRAVVPIEGLTHARREFLRLGADLEVLAPDELRAAIAAAARATADLYQS
jgi:predicted DNA-binding transcriptional regulator YafY